MTEYEFNNLLALLKEGSFENVSIAVGYMIHLDVDILKKLFIGIYELLYDEDWAIPLLHCNTKMISLVIPQGYPLCTPRVNIFYREFTGINNDTPLYPSSIRICNSIYLADEREVMIMANKLFKDYGYTI